MEVQKKHQNNVGKKRGLSTAIESEISAKKSHEKYKMKKMPQKSKKKKASNQAENGHGQHFQENTSTFSENPVPITQARISLTQKNQRIDFSLFSHL